MQIQNSIRATLESDHGILDVDYVANLLENLLRTWKHGKPTIKAREAIQLAHAKSIKVVSLWPQETCSFRNFDGNPEDDPNVPWLVRRENSSGPFTQPGSETSSLEQLLNGLGCIARILRENTDTVEARRAIDDHFCKIKKPAKLTMVAIQNIKKSMKRLLVNMSPIEGLEELFFQARSLGVPSHLVESVRPPIDIHSGNVHRTGISPRKRTLPEPFDESNTISHRRTRRNTKQ